MNQDEEHLKLLALFHYIVGGVDALVSLIPLIHVGLGIGMLSGKVPLAPAGAPGPTPDLIGWIFVAMGVTIIVLGETLAALTVAAGRSISKRRRHLFCLVVAGLNCVNIPLGTVLGVFTFVVLLRPSVKAVFQRAEHEPVG